MIWTWDEISGEWTNYDPEAVLSLDDSAGWEPTGQATVDGVTLKTFRSERGHLALEVHTP